MHPQPTYPPLTPNHSVSLLKPYVRSSHSQPDFPYQHHSELHGDKARAPTEGRGAGSAGPWTESMGGIYGGDWLVSDVSFLLSVYSWATATSKSSIWRWSVCTTYRLLWHIGYINTACFGNKACLHSVCPYVKMTSNEGNLMHRFQPTGTLVNKNQSVFIVQSNGTEVGF